MILSSPLKLASIYRTLLLLTWGHLETKAISNTSTDSTPKIWLSEYGYYFENEKDFGEEVSFPADSNFQIEENFQNDYIKKSGTDFVVLGNTTVVVFTCEAAHPIFWTFTQKLDGLVTPSGSMLIVNLRSSNTSGNGDKAFKSLLYLEFTNEFQHELSSVYEKTISNNPNNWTFTCHINQKVAPTNSITLRLENNENNQINPITTILNNQSLEKMTPEEKTIIAITRYEDKLHENGKITKVHLGDALYHVQNSNANKKQIILSANWTGNLNDLMEIGDENDLPHLYFKKNETEFHRNLLEYNVNDGIYEGDQIQIFCYSLNIFYAFGTYMQINWRNGTSTILEEEDDKNVEGITVFLDWERLANYSIFGYEDKGVQLVAELIYANLLFYLSKSFEANLEMKSVDCYMPVWSSKGEWDKVTHQLNILPKIQV